MCVLVCIYIHIYTCIHIYIRGDLTCSNGSRGMSCMARASRSCAVCSSVLYSAACASNRLHACIRGTQFTRSTGTKALSLLALLVLQLAPPTDSRPASEVLSLLALLVHKYKYWHLFERLGRFYAALGEHSLFQIADGCLQRAQALQRGLGRAIQ